MIGCHRLKLSKKNKIHYVNLLIEMGLKLSKTSFWRKYCSNGWSILCRVNVLETHFGTNKVMAVVSCHCPRRNSYFIQ